jgi:hypothetical protein
MLAVLLLASLAWASTVELTHNHGAGARPRGSLSTAQSQVPNESTLDQVSASKTNHSSSNSKSGAECLICQLHQNLSSSVIGHTPGDGPSETCGLNAPVHSVVQLAEFAAPGQGRAPPAFL